MKCKYTCLPRMLLATVLAVTLCPAIASACTQKEKNRIQRVNDEIEGLRKRHKCARISNNGQRAACWIARPLPDSDAKAYERLDGEYLALAHCKRDRVLFNLGDYRQSFGRSCEAVEAFNQVRPSKTFDSLPQVAANAILQCRRDSIAHGFDYLSKSESYLMMSEKFASSNDRPGTSSRSKVLTAWRDLFAVDANARSASKIAEYLVHDDVAWSSWESFLRAVRTRFPTRAASFYATPNNVRMTTRQYRGVSQRL